MSGGVPAGWVLVPVKPTEAMLDALARQAQRPTGWHNVYPAMYRVLLAAAPDQPTQAECIKCSRSILTENTPGTGFLAECGNRLANIGQCRPSGCTTPTPPPSRDADVERARKAAITAMGWTNPRMVEDGKRYLAGQQFASFGFGGECVLTARQVGALRRCYDGARAALQALGERG